MDLFAQSIAIVGSFTVFISYFWLWVVCNSEGRFYWFLLLAPILAPIAVVVEWPVTKPPAIALGIGVFLLWCGYSIGWT
jgi:hypothetical protein